MEDKKVIMEVNHLKKYFRVDSKHTLKAVDDVSFQVYEGETLGIVGESGCGKTTCGRTCIGVYEATDGEVLYKGKNIHKMSNAEKKEFTKHVQMIFQDPFASLNPRMTVEEIIAEPLFIYKVGSKQEIYAKIKKLMDTVGISERIANAYPHELDGGRRQRVGIARALALEPKLIVCDEPVSALDVSIQAQILNLMQDLQEEYQLTYIFITHDMSVVKHISDHILVMYMGCVVEYAPSDILCAKRYHPYTTALLSAVPVPDIHAVREDHLLTGEVTSPLNPKPGCRFAARCPYKSEKCSITDCELLEVEQDHFVACHHPRNI